MSIIPEKADYQASRRGIYDKITRLLDKNLPASYQKVIVGFFYIKHSPIPTIRVFYKGYGDNTYTNLIVDSTFDQSVSDLSDLCEELKLSMKKCYDNWTSFTYTREHTGLFRAKFDYCEIESVNHLFLLDWRSRYF